MSGITVTTRANFKNYSSKRKKHGKTVDSAHHRQGKKKQRNPYYYCDKKNFRWSLELLHTAVCEHEWDEAFLLLPCVITQLTPHLPLEFLWRLTDVITRNVSDITMDERKKFWSLLHSMKLNTSMFLDILSQDLAKATEQDAKELVQMIEDIQNQQRQYVSSKGVVKANKRFKALSDGYVGLINYNRWKKCITSLDGGSSSQPLEDESFAMSCSESQETPTLNRPSNEFSRIAHWYLKKALIGLDEPCEWFMLQFLELDKLLNGQKSAECILERYKSNPCHGPSHHLAYHFFKNLVVGSTEQQLNELECISKECPDDPLVLQQVNLYLYSLEHGGPLLESATAWTNDAKSDSGLEDSDDPPSSPTTMLHCTLQSRGKVELLYKCVRLLVSMLDYPDHIWDLQPWQKLTQVLCKFYQAWIRCWSCLPCISTRKRIFRLAGTVVPLWKHYVWKDPPSTPLPREQAQVLYHHVFAAFIFGYSEEYMNDSLSALQAGGHVGLREELIKLLNLPQPYLNNFKRTVDKNRKRLECISLKVLSLTISKNKNKINQQNQEQTKSGTEPSPLHSSQDLQQETGKEILSDAQSEYEVESLYLTPCQESSNSKVLKEQTGLSPRSLKTIFDGSFEGDFVTSTQTKDNKCKVQRKQGGVEYPDLNGSYIRVEESNNNVINSSASTSITPEKRGDSSPESKSKHRRTHQNVTSEIEDFDTRTERNETEDDKQHNKTRPKTIEINKFFNMETSTPHNVDSLLRTRLSKRNVFQPLNKATTSPRQRASPRKKTMGDANQNHSSKGKTHTISDIDGSTSDDDDGQDGDDGQAMQKGEDSLLSPEGEKEHSILTKTNISRVGSPEKKKLLFDESLNINTKVTTHDASVSVESCVRDEDKRSYRKIITRSDIDSGTDISNQPQHSSRNSQDNTEANKNDKHRHVENYVDDKGGKESDTPRYRTRLRSQNSDKDQHRNLNTSLSTCVKSTLSKEDSPINSTKLTFENHHLGKDIETRILITETQTEIFHETADDDDAATVVVQETLSQTHTHHLELQNNEASGEKQNKTTQEEAKTTNQDNNVVNLTPELSQCSSNLTAGQRERECDTPLDDLALGSQCGQGFFLTQEKESDEYLDKKPASTSNETAHFDVHDINLDDLNDLDLDDLDCNLLTQMTDQCCNTSTVSDEMAASAENRSSPQKSPHKEKMDSPQKSPNKEKTYSPQKSSNKEKTDSPQKSPNKEKSSPKKSPNKEKTDSPQKSFDSEEKFVIKEDDEEDELSPKTTQQPKRRISTSKFDGLLPTFNRQLQTPAARHPHTARLMLCMEDLPTPSMQDIVAYSDSSTPNAPRKTRRGASANNSLQVPQYPASWLQDLPLPDMANTLTTTNRNAEAHDAAPESPQAVSARKIEKASRKRKKKLRDSKSRVFQVYSDMKFIDSFLLDWTKDPTLNGKEKEAGLKSLPETKTNASICSTEEAVITSNEQPSTRESHLHASVIQRMDDLTFHPKDTNDSLESSPKEKNSSVIETNDLLENEDQHLEERDIQFATQGNCLKDLTLHHEHTEDALRTSHDINDMSEHKTKKSTLTNKKQLQEETRQLNTETTPERDITSVQKTTTSKKQLLGETRQLNTETTSERDITSVLKAKDPTCIADKKHQLGKKSKKQALVTEWINENILTVLQGSTEGNTSQVDEATVNTHQHQCVEDERNCDELINTPTEQPNTVHSLSINDEMCDDELEGETNRESSPPSRRGINKRKKKLSKKRETGNRTSATESDNDVSDWEEILKKSRKQAHKVDAIYKKPKKKKKIKLSESPSIHSEVTNSSHIHNITEEKNIDEEESIKGKEDNVRDSTLSPVQVTEGNNSANVSCEECLEDTSRKARQEECERGIRGSNQRNVENITHEEYDGETRNCSGSEEDRTPKSSKHSIKQEKTTPYLVETVWNSDTNLTVKTAKRTDTHSGQKELVRHSKRCKTERESGAHSSEVDNAAERSFSITVCNQIQNMSNITITLCRSPETDGTDSVDKGIKVKVQLTDRPNQHSVTQDRSILSTPITGRPHGVGDQKQGEGRSKKINSTPHKSASRTKKRKLFEED